MFTGLKLFKSCSKVHSTTSTTVLEYLDHTVEFVGLDPPPGPGSVLGGSVQAKNSPILLVIKNKKCKRGGSKFLGLTKEGVQVKTGGSNSTDSLTPSSVATFTGTQEP